MMDETGEAEETQGPGPYSGAPYASHAAHQQMSPATSASMEQTSGTGQPQQPQQQHGMSMTQLLDPSIDWDPFGLSASMAFPSSFSFDTSNMR